MISKSDLVLLLTDLLSSGVDTTLEILQLYKSSTIPISILKKINDARPLELLLFYEKLRESYNNKRSKLYINIMRSTENAIEDPKTILTTLSAMLTLILLFNCLDKAMFYKHSRANEISKVLNVYFTTGNLEPAGKLLALIKTDIKALEFVK